MADGDDREEAYLDALAANWLTWRRVYPVRDVVSASGGIQVNTRPVNLHSSFAGRKTRGPHYERSPQACGRSSGEEEEETEEARSL